MKIDEAKKDFILECGLDTCDRGEDCMARSHPTKTQCGRCMCSKCTRCNCYIPQ